MWTIYISRKSIKRNLGEFFQEEHSRAAWIQQIMFLGANNRLGLTRVPRGRPQTRKVYRTSRLNRKKVFSVIPHFTPLTLYPPTSRPDSYPSLPSISLSTLYYLLLYQLLLKTLRLTFPPNASSLRSPTSHPSLFTLLLFHFHSSPPQAQQVPSSLSSVPAGHSGVYRIGVFMAGSRRAAKC